MEKNIRAFYAINSMLTTIAILITFFYAYRTTQSIFISIVFFYGIVTFFKILLDAFIKNFTQHK